MRFAIGFLIGLLLVALHVLIEGTVGHIRWARADGPGASTIAMVLVTYILLACRNLGDWTHGGKGAGLSLIHI